MSTFPSGIARVPNLMVSQLSLANITRSNLGLFQVQTQLATGRAINRPSEDSVKSAMIGLLDQRLERSDQLIRNLNHAESAINVMDGAIGEANDLILEAKRIASTEVNFGASAEERANQAIVVQSLINELFNIGNRDSVAGHFFGGSVTHRPPLEDFLGGYRYLGEGDGLVTDIGLGRNTPITLGAQSFVGSTSERVVGTTELIPELNDDTRLTDLMGTGGLGITKGRIEFNFDGGPIAEIDLTQADTIGDIADTIERALRQYETDNGVTILDAGGVSVSGQSLVIDVVAGPPDPDLSFTDIGVNTTARDLGLSQATFNAATDTGADVRPKLVDTTPVGLIGGLPLGEIKITNMGQSRIVDLSTAQTFQDVRNLIESANLGIRVEFDAQNRRMIVVNEVSGGTNQAMSIEEVAGQNGTAERLGIRTMSLGTRLEDFNDGRGITIATGGSDPITGLPDPSKDVDFIINLGDAAGTQITVDLRPQDVTTVQALLDRINAQAAPQLAAAGLAPTDFQAQLLDGDNGIAFVQNPAFPDALSLTPDNNSQAAFQLGLMDGTYDPATGTLLGEDRAAVRVDSLFTALVDLRDALENNDRDGITLAGGRLDAFVDRVAQSRALVGGYSTRVASAKTFEEDRIVLDETMRSELRDLDYAEAATRFAMLQTQLQAGLQVTAQSGSLTLLDFLG